MINVVIIKPEGEPQLATIDPELEAFQQIVGGYIEPVGLYHMGAGAYINEEGKIYGLPYNEVASLLCHEQNAIFEFDDIAGPMVVFGYVDEDVDEEDYYSDIPPEVSAAILKTYEQVVRSQVS